GPGGAAVPRSARLGHSGSAGARGPAGLAEVERGATGTGDVAAGGAWCVGLHGGVLLQVPDEVVDPLVAGAVDLQLEAPRLQRDRRAQARVRRHQHEIVALHLGLEDVDLGLGEVGAVRDPYRTVLEAVYRVLARDLS